MDIYINELFKENLDLELFRSEIGLVYAENVIYFTSKKTGDPT